MEEGEKEEIIESEADWRQWKQAMKEESENKIVEVLDQKIDRKKINIQQFMDDMSMIGRQVNNQGLIKPVFHYGSLEITNYLLWLILSELMISNTKGEVK